MPKKLLTIFEDSRLHDIIFRDAVRNPCQQLFMLDGI